jgi:hypothetical protein
MPNAEGWHHCRCPVHNGDSTSVLALKNAPSSLLLVKCFKDCPKSAIHHEIDRLLLEGRLELSRPALSLSASVSAISEHEQVSWAARIWHSCHPGGASLVQNYLQCRGIVLHAWPSSLRFHPSLTHRPSDQRWPAMVALIRDVTGQPRAIHRTWLSWDSDAKAPVEKNKMTLGPLSGGAVRLGEATDAVAIAEGIETALSVSVFLDGQPVWASLSTSGMKAVQLPPTIRQVTIAADNDVPGVEAASALCQRLEAEGRSVIMIKPNREGTDFNDLLMATVR